MKRTVQFLLKQYKKMSGDKKIRIGLKLSESVRKVRQEGIKTTGA